MPKIVLSASERAKLRKMRKTKTHIQQPLVEDAVKPAVHINELLSMFARFNSTAKDALAVSDLSKINQALKELQVWCAQKGLNVSFDLRV